jgi:hypothetical protein
MSDLRIGRIVAASLHQSISDVLPDRLEFYELYLRSQGLRDGTIGLAPITAVLGFLRTEPAYADVVQRAGSLAAAWTVASMSAWRRRVVEMLPRPLRARIALGIAASIVTLVSSSSKAVTRLTRTNAQLDVTASLFCDVREIQKMPLCGFYAAAAAETLASFGLPARSVVQQCHAVEGGPCVIALDLSGADDAARSALAAA